MQRAKASVSAASASRFSFKTLMFLDWRFCFFTMRKAVPAIEGRANTFNVHAFTTTRRGALLLTHT